MDDESTIIHSSLVPLHIVSGVKGVVHPEKVFVRSFRIGRALDCDIQIVHNQVSRAHAEIVFEAGHWWVTDLCSTNGTYLNGLRVERELLPIQAKIELGDGLSENPPTLWIGIDEKPVVPDSIWQDVESSETSDVTSTGSLPPIGTMTVRFFDPHGRSIEKHFNETFRVGRAPECGVHVENPTVSKMHAELRVEDGQWSISDLQSTNGTFLNNIQIQREVLPPDAKLQLGPEGPIFWLSTSPPSSGKVVGERVDSRQSDVDQNRLTDSPQEATPRAHSDDLSVQQALTTDSQDPHQDILTDETIGPSLIRRPKRWDESFGPNMTDEDVDRILMSAPFKHIDSNAFPSAVPLRGILRHDTRILRFQQGDIVTRQGEYGNSAFFILSGSVQILLENLLESSMESNRPPSPGILQSLTTLLNNPKVPEFRNLFKKYQDTPRSTTPNANSQAKIFLQDMSAIIEKHVPTLLEAGEFFGETSALGRIPRVATTICASNTELVEIRWQGLRELRNRCSELKEHIDTLYRERNLHNHFRSTPMFQHLLPEQLQQVADETKFERYGTFDWATSFKTLESGNPSNRIEDEPIIATEGDYPNGLLLIRSGFARLSQRFGNGHRTHSFLQRGQTFGLEELLHNFHNTDHVSLQYSLRAIGYVDILFIPTRIVEDIILPTMPSDKLPLKKTPQISTHPHKSPETEIAPPSVDPDMLEFLVEERFINGTATMLIDLDRCTRCDDCVRACSGTHNNNPRFIRHGKQFGKYMVANACMHCSDPVCMIGCPTGAIHRESFQGNVIIQDEICIGCATCANSCPYHNIRMVEIRDHNGNFFLDQDSHKPIMKATKCDLCSENPAGPACQRACPHDALVRIGMQELEPLANWLKR